MPVVNISAVMPVVNKSAVMPGREAMGGTGGSPPDFLYFTFLWEYFGGEPPVPPIASTLSFSFFYNNK
jgi:hypothetical protein